MRFVYLFLVLMMVGVVSAQGNITNLIVSQPLPDFVAGDFISTVFSFDYPDLSSVYSGQVEGAPLVFVVNISSNDSLYPVWKGDFVLDGSLRSFDNFVFSDYEFDCFEDSFSVNCPYCPFDVGEIPNGTFYCTDAGFFRLGLGSENVVTLNVLSDVALWPGSYNYSVGLFYPERNWTMLVVSPAVPDGLNGWYVSEPIFTLVNGEADEIFYQWDSGDVYLYGSPFGLENILNAPPIESAGILDLNWWANVSCEIEGKMNRSFRVDLISPVFDDLLPVPDDVVYDFAPEIGAYLDEVYQGNSGINVSSLIVKVDGVDVSEEVNVSVDELDAFFSFVPDWNLSFGEHKVYVYVEDNAGWASSVSWFFDVGGFGSGFNMSVNSPLDGLSDSRRVRFNVTTTEEVEKIEYINYADGRRARWRRLCRDCEEYGFSRKKTKSLREGNNTLGFRAIDEFGFVVEENVSVFVDSKKPRISRVLPRRNKFTNGSGFYVKFREENPVRLSVFYNESLNLSLENCSEDGRYMECWFDFNLSSHDPARQGSNGASGEIEYRFEMEDIVGNVVSSKLTRVNVDTTAPVLENNDSFWEQGLDRKARYVYFDLNISEENLDEVNYVYNDTRGWLREKRLCSRLRGGVCEKRKSFRRGEVLLGVRIVDEAGNFVFEEIGLEVDY